MLTDSASQQVEARQPRRRWRGLLVVVIAISVVFGCLAFLTARQVALFEQLRAIDQAWTGVDRAITQRAERALQLAERVDSSARVTRLVGRLDAAASPRERIEANHALDEAIEPLRRIESPAENASKELEAIRDSLDEAERDISARRREYNGAVQSYNTRIQLFPDNFASWIAGLERVEEYVR